MIGLSMNERRVIRSLVELTRQIEDVDREFTAQMLSMECKLTEAFVGYSDTLCAEATDEEPLSSVDSSESASPSELSSEPEAESKPPTPPPNQLVNDLVLLDRGQLSPPMMVAGAVGNVDRSSLPDLAGSSDDSRNSSPASPMICTPDIVVNVSASPAPSSSLPGDGESDKPSHVGSVSYFDYQPSVQSV